MIAKLLKKKAKKKILQAAKEKKHSTFKWARVTEKLAFKQKGLRSRKNKMTSSTCWEQTLPI